MESLYIVDLVGTMVFAISGASAAASKKLDLFGVAFTGFVTSIGGGSLRDIFLNTRPVWIDDGNYLFAIMTGVVIFVCFRKWLMRLYRTLFLFDAIGIGFFTIVGLQKSLLLESHPAAAVVLGMFSAVMGGVIRDTLMNETPLIFRKEIYATACLCGAGTYILLESLQINNLFNILISAGVVVFIRVISMKYKITMPHLTNYPHP